MMMIEKTTTSDKYQDQFGLSLSLSLSLFDDDNDEKEEKKKSKGKGGEAGGITNEEEYKKSNKKSAMNRLTRYNSEEKGRNEKGR